jgi:putative hydrolase of the HAD superfamily
MPTMKELAIARILAAKGFLLDYDGLLVDTEAIYFQTWCDILNEEGRHLCSMFHQGRHESEVYALVKEYVSAEFTSFGEVSAHREEAFSKIVEKDGINLMPGWATLFPQLECRGAVFVVSNSATEDVLRGLKKLGIAARVSGVFGYGTSVRPKPDPFLYNWAVRESNLPPSTLVAFEDSPSGLLAADSAGVFAICISEAEESATFSVQKNIAYFRSATEIIDVLHK